jgi:probable phosphoglycerate mutase
MRKTLIAVFIAAVLVIGGAPQAAASAVAQASTAKRLSADLGGEVTFYVTRHGRTLFNAMERAQGWSDTPLTQAGVEVAEDLGRGLQDVQFHYVVSSDLTRARQTARLVMAQNKASSTRFYDESDMLREACYGSYEGDINANMLDALSKAGGFEDFPAFSQSAGTQMWLISADLIKQIDATGMAEDGKTIKTRMQNKLRQIAEEQSALGGGNVLLVAHGMSINIMLSDLDPDFDYQGTALANAAVCKVVYKNGSFTIQSFNDTSYIEAGKELR